MNSLHYSLEHDAYVHRSITTIDTNESPRCRAPTVANYDHSPQLVAIPSYSMKDVSHSSHYASHSAYVDDSHAYHSHVYQHPSHPSPRSQSVTAVSTPTEYLQPVYTPESMSTYYDPHGSPASTSTAYSSLGNSRRPSLSEAVDIQRRASSLEYRTMSSSAPIPSYVGSHDYTRSIQRYVVEDEYHVEPTEQVDHQSLSRRSSPAAHCSTPLHSPHSPYYIPTPPTDLYYPQPFPIPSEYLPPHTSTSQPRLSPPIATLHRLSISSTSPFLPYPSPSTEYFPLPSPAHHLSPPHPSQSRRGSSTSITSTSSTSSLPPVVKPSRAVVRAAAKALKEANKGKLTFVNYTPADHKALLGGVAPSGTSKRSRSYDGGEEERKRSRSLSG